MCMKHFIGFPCGHCSVPTLLKCPIVTSDPRFPICTNPAEQPHQSDTVCHPCSRVLWNNEVLRKESEHKKLHREGKCGCDTVFQDLEDTTVAFSTPQSPQTQYLGTEQIVPWTPYPPFFGMNMGVEQAAFDPYDPVKMYQTLLYQRDEDRLAFAKQYVQEHSEQQLYYDHHGYIYLYVPGKEVNPNDLGVQVPTSAKDIHGRPPLPASLGRSNHLLYNNSFARTDFLQLDVITLQLEARCYNPVAVRAAYDADQASKTYGMQWERVPSASAPGLVGMSNYAGSVSPTSIAPSQPYGVSVPGFNAASSTNYVGSSSNYPTASSTSYTHRNSQASLAPPNSAAPLPPPGYYNPNQGMNQTWNTATQPQQQDFQPYSRAVEPQQPDSGYGPMRGYGGGKYRQARYGPGHRYHPEAPQPFSGAPNDSYIRQGSGMTTVNPSGNNIESLTQLENLKIGAGGRHMQHMSHQSGTRRGQRSNASNYEKRTSQRTTQAPRDGVSHDNAGPKVKLPDTANSEAENEATAQESIATITTAPPTTPKSPPSSLSPPIVRSEMSQ